MLGPTAPTTRPTCSGTDSPVSRISRCNACTKIKILSTPTARTKNGITSIIIKVADNPVNEHAPRDAATDNKTITTPTIPTVTFASTY